MKICPKCGKQCEDSYLFCNSCGCSLEPGSTAEQMNKDGSNKNPIQNQSTASAAAPSQNSNAADFTGASQQQYSSNFGTQPQNQYQSANPGQYQGNFNTNYSYQGQYNSSNPYAHTWQTNVPVEPKNNPFALASFILGIVGVAFMCFYFIGTIPAILSIVFGFVGRSKIKASGGREKGLGFTTAGISLGIIALVIMVLLIILAAIGISFLSTIGNNYSKFSDLDDLFIHNLRLFKF